jgi:hypothetical protein
MSNIFQVKHIVNNKINHIYFFSNNESLKPNTTHDYTIIKYPIHKDDSIKTIKEKIMLYTNLEISINEIYLFTNDIRKISLIQSYNEITQKDNYPLDLITINNFLSNIILEENDVFKSKFKISKRKNISFNSVIKLPINWNEKSMISLPLGQTSNLLLKYHFPANPYNFTTIDRVLHTNIDKMISPHNNDLFFEYTSMPENVIYMCSAKDMEPFCKKYSIPADLLFKLYFPRLYSIDKIINFKSLNENNTLYIKNKTISEKNNCNKIVDLFLNMKDEKIQYTQIGISKINFTIHPNDEIKLPLEIIFKIINSNSNILLVKHNPGKSYENVFRLYCDKYISKNGKKLPVLYVNNKHKYYKITNLSKEFGFKNSVTFYIVFENQELTCEFFENGNIRIKINFNNNPRSINDIEKLVHQTLNDLLLIKIHHFLKQSGYSYIIFDKFTDKNIEINDIKYNLKFPFKKKIHLKPFMGCLSCVFNINKGDITQWTTDEIKLNYKRVSFYQKMDALHAFIYSRYQDDAEQQEIMEDLMTNFQLDENEAKQEYNNWDKEGRHKLNTFQNKKRQKVNNPGFEITMKYIMDSDTTKKFLNIDIENINKIEYIQHIHYYISALINIALFKKEDEEIKKLCKDHKEKNVEDELEGETIKDLNKKELTGVVQLNIIESDDEDDDTVDDMAMEFFSKDGDSSDDSSDDDSSDDDSSDDSSDDDSSDDDLGSISDDEGQSGGSISISDLEPESCCYSFQYKYAENEYYNVTFQSHHGEELIWKKDDGEIFYTDDDDQLLINTLMKSRARSPSYGGGTSPRPINPNIEDPDQLINEQLPAVGFIPIEQQPPVIVPPLNMEQLIAQQLEEQTNGILIQEPVENTRDRIVPTVDEFIGYSSDDEELGPYPYMEEGELDFDTGENMPEVARPRYPMGNCNILGGGKKEEELDIDLTNISLSGARNYFVNRIKNRQSELITKEDKKTGFKGYAKSCQWQYKRVPIILSDEEKEYIDQLDGKNKSYDESIESVGKDGKKNHYICPRYWCIRDDNGKGRSLSLEQVNKGECGGWDAVIPSNSKKVPKGKRIFEFTDNRYHRWDSKSNNPLIYNQHYPNFLNPDKHPKGLCAPCCFATPSSYRNFKKIEKEIKGKKKKKIVYSDGKRELSSPPKFMLKNMYESTPEPKFERDKKGNIKLETIEGKKAMRAKTQPAREKVYNKCTGNEKSGEKKMIPYELKVLEAPLVGTFPLMVGKLGYLSVSMQKFLGFNNVSMCYKAPNDPTLKKDTPCLLRLGIENSKNQSFLSAIASIYNSVKDLKNNDETYIKLKINKPELTIKELKDIIIKNLTLDKFVSANKGNLINHFGTNDNIRFTNEMKESKIYQGIDNKKSIYLKKIGNGYKNFIEYLKDEDIEISYEFLWDLICEPITESGILFETGINLIIFNSPKDDITDKIEIICPKNDYSDSFFNKSYPTIFLYKEYFQYEPIIQVEMGENIEYNLKKYFEFEKMKDYENISEIIEILEYIQNQLRSRCVDLQSNEEYGSKYKDNIYLNELLKYTELYEGKRIQLLNDNGQVIGIFIENGDEQKYIPCKPSPIKFNLDFEYIKENDMKRYNGLDETLRYLNNLYEESGQKILSKPLVILVDDGMVVGIITITNQLVPIYPPEIYTKNEDNLEVIEGYNEYKVDNETMYNEKIDDERVKVVKKLRLENNFYTLFRNMFKMLINNKENIEKKKELMLLINNKEISYLTKLKKVRNLLKKVLKKYILFSELKMEIEELEQCLELNKEGCEKSSSCSFSIDEETCRLIIPKKNLINEGENEKKYYLKLSDELIRYIRIRKYIFTNRTFLSFNYIEYDIKDNEIILLEENIRSYLENEISYVSNKYITKRNIYDTININKGKKYSNKVYKKDDLYKIIKKKKKKQMKKEKLIKINQKPKVISKPKENGNERNDLPKEKNKKKPATKSAARNKYKRGMIVKMAGEWIDKYGLEKLTETGVFEVKENNKIGMAKLEWVGKSEGNSLGKVPPFDKPFKNNLWNDFLIYIRDEHDLKDGKHPLAKAWQDLSSEIPKIIKQKWCEKWIPIHGTETQKNKFKQTKRCIQVPYEIWKKHIN